MKDNSLEIRPLTESQFYNYIDEISLFDAIEIHRTLDQDGLCHVLIPYLMNDSVESYLRMEACVIEGEWKEDRNYKDCVIRRDTNHRKMLIFQKNQIVLNISYEHLYMETHCYQYHLIGHNWRKEAGQERLRRAVNLLCVLHDKYSYLGESFCNDTEIDLYPLMEFAPLSSYSPINQSIQDWYPETMDGVDAMIHLATQAEDQEYLELLYDYEAICYALENAGEQEREESETLEHYKEMYQLLYQKLAQEEHKGIVEHLERMLQHASFYWPQRYYGEKQEESIENKRAAAIEIYAAKGYVGNYPVLRKDDSTLYFWEEHPFTVLEWDHYHFHIYAYEENTEGKKYEEKIKCLF